MLPDIGESCLAWYIYICILWTCITQSKYSYTLAPGGTVLSDVNTCCGNGNSIYRRVLSLTTMLNNLPIQESNHIYINIARSLDIEGYYGPKYLFRSYLGLNWLAYKCYFGYLGIIE